MRSPTAPSETAPVEAAFVSWRNDDLLVSEEARRALGRLHPTLAPLFDWPALRARFEVHDARANHLKRGARAAGRRAVATALATFTAAAAAGLPLGGEGSWLGAAWPALPGGAAAVFAALSVHQGLSGLLWGGRKEAWMLERFWTETLRRFSFQFHLLHLPLAVRVADGEAPIEAWRAAQDEAFAALVDGALLRPEDALAAVLRDTTESRIWVLEGWRRRTPTPPSAGPTSEALLSVLTEKRLQSQVDYTTRKLEGTKTGLRRLARLTRGWFYGLVFATLLLQATAGVLLVLATTWPVATAAAVVAFCGSLSSALGLALQMWDRGEFITGEADRMEWYLTSMESLHQRLDGTPEPGMAVHLLAEAERVAYIEMRQFLVQAAGSEFIAG